jgi:uncharacterized membrane protein
MASLTVWKFQSPEGAEATEATLLELQKQQLIQIADAAVVCWPEGERKPRIRQLTSLVGFGALSGAFWGMLFGLIFLMPLLGAAVGAAAGALGGQLTRIGIDEDFIDKVKSQVTPGTSALFLLAEGAVAERIRQSFPGTQAQLIESNLTEEEETRLREVFAA